MIFTAKDIAELRERNEQRLKKAKEKLGTAWLLHPANSPKKKVLSLK